MFAVPVCSDRGRGCTSDVLGVPSRAWRCRRYECEVRESEAHPHSR